MEEYDFAKAFDDNLAAIKTAFVEAGKDYVANGGDPKNYVTDFHIVVDDDNYESEDGEYAGISGPVTIDLEEYEEDAAAEPAEDGDK